MCAKLTMKEECKQNTLNLEKYPHIKDSELFKILKCLPRLGRGGPWVAGGSVWRTVNNEMLKDCDVDIYFSSALAYEQSCRQMSSYPLVNNVLAEKKNKWNTTFQIHVNEGKYDKTIDVQFIGMSYYSRLEKLLNSFDFPVCQFGYDGKDIIVGSKSLADLEKRQLSIHRIDYPKTALKHMLKYLNNGFVVPPDELKRLVKCVLEMDCWSKSASGKYNNDDGQLKEVMEDYLMETITPEVTTAFARTPAFVEQETANWGTTTIEMPATGGVQYNAVTFAPTAADRRTTAYTPYYQTLVNRQNHAPRPDINFNAAVGMDDAGHGYGPVNTGGPNTVPQPDQNPTPVVQEPIRMNPNQQPPFADGFNTLTDDRPQEVNNRVIYDQVMGNTLQNTAPANVEECDNAAAHRILRRLRDMGEEGDRREVINGIGEIGIHNRTGLVAQHNDARIEAILLNEARRVRPAPVNDTLGEEWEGYRVRPAPINNDDNEWDGYGYHPEPRN